MGDFVSQGTLDQGAAPVPDALGHDQTARAILHKAVFLPPGAVMAVQGSWGRGKTDVLTRVAALVRDAEQHGLPSGLIADALWINPWQYGTPDLLTPLVLSMLGRLPDEKKRNDRRLRKVAESLLRAGLNFGLKALTTGVPILSMAADPVDKMVAGLFEAAGMKGESDRPDPDPVSVMGERFRELSQALLEAKQRAPDARLLVCIDDLDRCLPDRQVALLEAVRFLISSGAPVTFLIALDPVLARQAILTHYRTDVFDPDRYLDKMFDLRINLPSIGGQIQGLVRHHMDREMRALGHTMKIRDAMSSLLSSNGPEELEKAALTALAVPDLANPRVVRRIFDRLYLLSVSRSADKLRPLLLNGSKEHQQLLAWLGVAERFPAVRSAAQAAPMDPSRDTNPRSPLKPQGDSFAQRLTVLHRAYTFDQSADAASAVTSTSDGELIASKETSPFDSALALYRVPLPKHAPDLSTIFKVMYDTKGEWTIRIQEIDNALVLAGL